MRIVNCQNKFVAVLLCLGIALLGVQVNAAEPHDKEKATRAVSPEGAENIAKLFKALVTTNEKPFVYKSHSGYRMPVFPPSFDWEEYKRVIAAIDELEKRLAENVEEVWPILVDHMCDPEYSFTVDAYDSAYNYSRGYVCYCLARSWVNGVYAGLMPMDRPLYQYQAPHSMDPKALQKWCRERRDKKLYEIQIEAGEWALSIIPTESEMDEEDQQRAIKEIQKRIDRISKSKKPIAGKFFSVDVICPYSKEDAESFRRPDKEELEPKLNQLCP